MEFLVDNYIIIIITGLFFVFALIGYLIDMIRNNKEKNKNNLDNSLYEKITDLEVKDKLQEQVDKIEKEENNKEIILDEADELLESYNNKIDE
ncbi:MAG: hypothetical protein IJD92_03410 [Bacilli bacterium]|nr:hypothetical protein [Bacilli bacterium]